MSDEQKPIDSEPEFKPTVSPAQIAEALAKVRGRSFSGRHPELGKMKKCQMCGLRHREVDAVYHEVFADDLPIKVKTELKEVRTGKCEQAFTYTVKDKDGRVYEQFREEYVTDPEGQEGPQGEVPKKATLVPNYRTAVPVNAKPTIKQIVGAAQFAKKRFHPHHSKIKLQFIERTRIVYDQLKSVINLLGDKRATRPKLEQARFDAARQLRAERRARAKATRRMQEYSRRINRGFPKYSA